MEGWEEDQPGRRPELGRLGGVEGSDVSGKLEARQRPWGRVLGTGARQAHGVWGRRGSLEPLRAPGQLADQQDPLAGSLASTLLAGWRLPGSPGQVVLPSPSPTAPGVPSGQTGIRLHL